MRHNSPEETVIVGESPEFLAVLEQASRLAQLNKPVLVIGERGTGKELIAARLHYLSARWQAALLKVNCAALSDTLLESELFGHESGAFTGAGGQHRGYFERASDGSLMLDEIGVASLRVQEQILRVIEYGQFVRVGGRETVNVDVRVIASTNEDLPQLTETGRFRADLLDRLAFDVITLPPLRHRQSDIPLLADHFGRQMAAELGNSLFAGFSQNALDEMQAHDWPGNVRELKNVVERAVYRHETPDEPISHLCLNPFISPYRPIGRNRGGRRDSDMTGTKADQEPVDLKAAVKSFEIKTIVTALKRHGYNQRKAAVDLKLSYDQLRGYIRKYGLINAESG